MTREEENIIGWYKFWRAIYREFSPKTSLESDVEIFRKNLLGDNTPRDIALEVMTQLSEIISNKIESTVGECKQRLLDKYNSHNDFSCIDIIIQRIRDNDYTGVFGDPNNGFEDYNMIPEGDRGTFSIVGVDFNDSDEIIIKKVRSTIAFYRVFFDLPESDTLISGFDDLKSYLMSHIREDVKISDSYRELLLAQARESRFQVRTNGKRAAGIYLWYLRNCLEPPMSASAARFKLRESIFEEEKLMDILGIPYDTDDRQLDRYYSNAKLCIEKGDVIAITK